MTNIMTCRECKNSWPTTSEKWGHCAGCHRTFSSLFCFDTHRVSRNCVNPGEIFTKTGKPYFKIRVYSWGEAWGKYESRLPETYAQTDPREALVDLPGAP